MVTVRELTELFLRVLDQGVGSGRVETATREWYRFQLAHLDRIAGDQVAAGLIPEHLSAAPFTYHFCRAVKRLFRWAFDAGHVAAFRFGGFVGPPCGQRERVLDEDEFRLVMKSAGRCLRRILWFLRHTLARPGELRQLRWREVFLEASVIRLRQFKARDRRKDGVRVRVIPLTPIVVRLLGYWKRLRRPGLDDHVFTNDKGKPYTVQTLRRAMARATKRAGINDGTDERAVCYTIRHTGATNATRNGVLDRTLADILGHTSTRTTARYQHLGEPDLVDAMKRATRRPDRAAG